MSDHQWAAPGPVPPHGGEPPVPPDSGQGWPGAGDGAPPPPPPGYAAPPPAPPGYMAPPPRMEYRPGIIPLRPLTLGEIWGGVFATVRGNPAATLGLALLTTAVALVPTTALAIWLAGQDLALAEIIVLDSEGATDPYLTATLASYVPALSMWVVSILLPLFVALVIGHAIQGRKVTLGQTWQQTKGRILTAVATTLLVLAMFVALIAALIVALVLVWSIDSTGLAATASVLAILAATAAGIHLWVKVGFAVTIVVLEGSGARRAIGRSWQLTRGRQFWRIFGIRVLTTIVATIAGSVVATPVALIALLASGDPDTSALQWVLPLTQAVSVLMQGVLVTPFVSGVDSLLYVDQRMRREGLDVQLMQQLHTSPST